MKSNLVVAVDGPVGAGKSSVAKLVSKKLGIIYVDTGAMYRAVGLHAIRNNVNMSDEEQMKELIKDINITVTLNNGIQQVYLNNENVNDLIRTPEISMAASKVATIPAVRLKLVEVQRNLAKDNDVIMDGRDIGTYVFPNATKKFYLVASIEERSRRRHAELIQKGHNVTLEDVKNDVEARDKNDSSRQMAPLKPADDAIIYDTTGKTLEKVVDELVDIIQRTT